MPLALVESSPAAWDRSGDFAGYGYRYVPVGFAMQQAHGEIDLFQAEIPGADAHVRVPGNPMYTPGGSTPPRSL